MEELKFDFIKKDTKMKLDLLELKLRDAGNRISKYAEQYFFHFVSTMRQKNKVKGTTLWLLMPRIAYKYKMMSLDYLTSNLVKATLYNLGGENVRERTVDISDNDKALTKVIIELLQSEEAAKSLHFLVQEVEAELLEKV